MVGVSDQCGVRRRWFDVSANIGEDGPSAIDRTALVKLAERSSYLSQVVSAPQEFPVEHSALYEAMGYTPKRDRKSGLHRSKHKEPDTK